MAFPDNLMAKGERVVLHKHPHWKVLVLPSVVFVAIIVAGSFFATWVSKWRDEGLTSHIPWYIAVVVVCLALFVWLCLAPFVQWRTEHFVLTTRHVFFRTGILHRRQHQIPLVRVQNIETVVTFWGRIFGYGTLIVDSAADEPLSFANVASLTKVQGTLNQLIADDRDMFPDPDDPRTRFIPRPTQELNVPASGDGHAGNYDSESHRRDPDLAK